MDVKYIPSDWEKMKDGIGDLIGLGRWGKGMIDELKDLSDNLEDAESHISQYDSDGVISFHHTSQKDRYQSLYEDFKILHGFSGKVGDIVDRTIDQPFYEDMDAFVEAMRDLTISNYTTKNRIGATETQIVYGDGYGPAQTFVVPKTEVSMDDLLSGDNFYAGQMKLEYEAWKELNADQDFTQEEYQQAVLNTRAFEYESIRNQQENKEFWVHLGALVVIVGATLICPPAGMALGAAYGAMELSSAVSGKDWVSGRELGTGERWVRGLLAPLDIVPGVSGLTKFSSTVRLAHIGDIGQFGLRTGVKGSLHQGITHVDNMVKTAGQQSVLRLKNATTAIKDGTNVAKNKLAKDTLEAGRLIDTAITQVKNITPSRKMGLAMESGGDMSKVHIPVENTYIVENKLKDVLSKIDGVNLGAKNVKVETIEKIPDSILSILKENNISVEEFQRIKLTPVKELTDREKNLIFYIRESIEKPTADTLMSKVMPIDAIDGYLREHEPYTTIGGFVAKYEDVANSTRDYKETIETLRLDYEATTRDGVPYRPYPDEGDSYAVIRYKYRNTDDLIDIPYGTDFYGTNTASYPCTLNGFLGGRNGTIVPEWVVSDYGRAKIQEGAEMYKVINGQEELIALFDGKRFRLLK